MSLGKWILGGLGFVLGGPIGAVIGVVLGSLFESGVKSLPTGDNYDNGTAGGGESGPYSQSRQGRQARPTQGDIRVSILVLVSCVMKADGHVKKQELEVVKGFLRKNYTETEAKDALQLLKKLLEQNINYVSVAQQIRINVNYSTRLEILHFLLDLAHADGEYASQEEYVIEQISAALGLSNADYRSLLALYGKKRDPNWAYLALEIEPSATDDEVKKAYRRMAMKYHPDKVASAGDDVKQKATEKFRAINEAYEYIKSLRGIN